MYKYLHIAIEYTKVKTKQNQKKKKTTTTTATTTRKTSAATTNVTTICNLGENSADAKIIKE